MFFSNKNKVSACQQDGLPALHSGALHGHHYVGFLTLRLESCPLHQYSTIKAIQRLRDVSPCFLIPHSPVCWLCKGTKHRRCLDKAQDSADVARVDQLPPGRVESSAVIPTLESSSLSSLLARPFMSIPRNSPPNGLGTSSTSSSSSSPSRGARIHLSHLEVYLHCLSLEQR